MDFDSDSAETETFARNVRILIKTITATLDVKLMTPREVHT